MMATIRKTATAVIANAMPPTTSKTIPKACIYDPVGPVDEVVVSLEPVGPVGEVVALELAGTIVNVSADEIVAPSTN